jgi:hypothetical protein
VLALLFYEAAVNRFTGWGQTSRSGVIPELKKGEGHGEEERNVIPDDGDCFYIGNSI